MKKIGLGIILILLLLLTGCSFNTKIDFNKLEASLLGVQSNKVELDSIISSVEIDEIILPKMDSLFIQDMDNKFNIDGKNLFKDGIIRIPSYDTTVETINKSLEELFIKDNSLKMYLVLEPLDGKLEEAKIAMDNYFDQLENHKESVNNMIKTTVDGYLVYIMTDNNDQVLNLIRSSKPKVFESFISLSDEEFSNKYSIPIDYIDELYVKIPKMSEDNATLLIVKGKNGKSTKIKNILDKYFEDLEQKLNYVKEKELVSNRIYERIGNYTIYVISNDNEKVLNIIKESIIEKE